MSDVQYTPGQGINIGDAVLTFLGDTQSLDRSMDSLNERVEVGMGKASASTKLFGQSLDSTGESAEEAGSEIQESMTKSTGSIGEARGAAMLLGEEIGVHLPRHAIGFISTLPGVGEALSAAFSTVAIIAVLEAVVRLTEKATEFISTMFIYTQAMKDADAAVVSLNKTLLDQEATIAKLDAAYQSMTMTPLQLLTKQLDDVNAAIAKQEADVRNASDQLFGYRDGTVALTAAQKAAYENIVADSGKAMEVLADQNRNISTSIDQLYSNSAKAAEELKNKNLATFNALMQEQRNYAGQLVLEYNNLTQAIMRLPTTSASSVTSMLPPLLQLRDSLSNGQQAAHDLGVTLKSDLANDLDIATTKLEQFYASGIKDDVALTQMIQKVEQASKAYQDFGKETDGTSKQLQIASQAATTFGSDLASGFIAAASGGEAWGKAMEQATGKALSALGQYCQVQAMAALAAGLAGDPSMYAAAAEYEAAALACGIAGAAGGGSGSGSNGSHVNAQPIQTTGGTSQTPTNSTNVQHFASGGLISSPTLAVIGDSPSGGSQSEGVLPLDNPEAMKRIAGAIAEHMGGGGSDGGVHFHNNIRGGVIDSSTLKSVMRQMSKRVQKGTGLLHSSNTFRVTKRSS
jgi:hypothetical protein